MKNEQFTPKAEMYFRNGQYMIDVELPENISTTEAVKILSEIKAALLKATLSKANPQSV